MIAPRHSRSDNRVFRLQIYNEKIPLSRDFDNLCFVLIFSLFTPLY